MNDSTITLILSVGIFLAGSLAVFLWLRRSWRRLPQRVRDEYRQELTQHQTTLLVLLALGLLPPAIYLYAGLEFYPLPVTTVGAVCWASLAIWFWELRANPAVKNYWEEDELTSRLSIPRPMMTPSRLRNPIPIPPLTDPDLVHKVFCWTYVPEDRQQTIEMDICQSRYDQYHQEPRLPIKAWAKYVTVEMPEVRVLSIHFQNLHLQREWCTFEQVSNVLSFTQQCIPYSLDKTTTELSEWPRYPIETLMDETGDCEDAAILTAAVLARIGFQVALLEYPAHVALGVAGANGLPGHFVIDHDSGKRYFYAETTAEGWHIGEIPKKYRGTKSVRILPVEILIEQ